MATLIPTPDSYLRSAVRPKGKVLLVNPPVQEKRYHWLKWNQPLELLRLATWITVREPSVGVRLFDFMLPNVKGEVSRHKVKETWIGHQGGALWHFGRPFEEFDRYLDELVKRGWVPDTIIISSLTSYWHIGIEKLLLHISNLLGPKFRPHVTIALYGVYASIESEHAEQQLAADVAFTTSVDTSLCMPAFELYYEQWKVAPLYFGLDIEARDVAEHLALCVELKSRWDRRRGIGKAQIVTAAFLNDDLCGPKSRLVDLAKQAERYQGRVRIDAICGVHPHSMGSTELEMLIRLGLKSIFIEYATQKDGRIDEGAYKQFRELFANEQKRRRSSSDMESLDREALTAFVNIGLPSDNIETIVRNTLVLNQYFQAIILKPFGYSPDIDPAPATVRRERWPIPANSSPQWYPYVGHGSRLTLEDYDNLMRWQGVLKKRVKGFTFDFLGDGTVPKLLRETLVQESWKQRRVRNL